MNISMNEPKGFRDELMNEIRCNFFQALADKCVEMLLAAQTGGEQAEEEKEEEEKRI